MIWPVHVINMASNTTRMARAAAELDSLNIPFTRFEAVNGRALSPDDLARVHDPAASRRRARRPLIGPEIGCYLSHVALWEEIAAGDAPGGIILEDDFAAADDLAAVLEAIARDEGDWEIAKLFSARVGQKLLDRRPLSKGARSRCPTRCRTRRLAMPSGAMRQRGLRPVPCRCHVRSTRITSISGSLICGSPWCPRPRCPLASKAPRQARSRRSAVRQKADTPVARCAMPCIRSGIVQAISLICTGIAWCLAKDDPGRGYGRMTWPHRHGL